MSNPLSQIQTRRRFPKSTDDLLPPERQFVATLQRLGFGHVECVKIRRGVLALEPSPTVVKVLKFGAAESQPPNHPADFELKKSMVDFFEYVRGVDDGEIRRLEVRHGLPFSMEIASRFSRGMPDVKGEHVEAV
jgi:hypothetical protein